MRASRKGQHELLTLVLITGILIGVVGVVWMWAVPMIEKNQDVSVQRNAEEFMKDLNQKIRSVSAGGEDSLDIGNLGDHGIILVREKEIELIIEVDESLYESNREISLSRNDCSDSVVKWGLEETYVICVRSSPVGEEYRVSYTLKYLEAKNGDFSMHIQLVPRTIQAGVSRQFVSLEGLGFQESRGSLTRLVAVQIV